MAEAFFLSLPRETGQPAQEQHFQDVARFVGHGDDVLAEDLWAGLFRHRAHQVEHGQGFARGGGQLPAVQGDRPLHLLEVLLQGLDASGFGQAGVVGLVHELQDFGDRLGVAGRFLAQVEPRKVEAERLHQPDQVGQFAVGDAAVALLDQRVVDQPQVVEELALVLVAVCTVPGPALQVIEPVLQPVQDDLQLGSGTARSRTARCCGCAPGPAACGRPPGWHACARAGRSGARNG